MSAYSSYVDEVSSREKEGLQPKPIESADLTAEIIAQIKDCLLYTSPSPRDRG